MPQATNAITIRRPVETVFSFVRDIKRVSRDGVGTRYTQGA